MRKLLILLMAFVIMGLFFGGCQKVEESKKSTEKPKIYDEMADVEADIEAALTEAKKDEKRVLIMFGGNWCPWCHRLHHLFETDKMVKKALNDGFILVMANVPAEKEKRPMALNEKFGNPFQHGFPVIVVLDADGNQLTTQETGSLEKPVVEGQEKSHDPEKVLAFFEQWAL